MSIRDRIASVEEAYGALSRMGRDPSTLRFDDVFSPTRARLEGRPVTLFGTNNYLGLTFDPACQAAASKGAQSFGSGTTGSRIANGSYAGHAALEREIADFYGKAGAIVFSTGYVANLGMVTALVGRDDHVLIDADSHASIYDACRMAEAETLRFRHNDPANLARRLERMKDTPGIKLVIVEGLYSMLGDRAPLAEFAAVVREAGEDVHLMVDEAHSLGVLGEGGRGLCEEAGVEADVDFVVGTFSKSVGTVGGFCVSDIDGFDRLRLLSRPYMFTASMTPGTVETARAAFGLIRDRPDLRARLTENAAHLHAGVKALGLGTGPQASPVVAVKLPEPETAVRVWNRLIDEGIYTNVALPPATPNGLSLLRVSVSAAHEPAQIDDALDALAAVGVEHGLVAPGLRPRRRTVLRVINGDGEPATDARARTGPPPTERAVPTH